MKNTRIHGFNFIEILIIITILALVSVIAYTSLGISQDKAVNAKIQSEISSLSNALLAYKQENSELPQPQGNKNFFAEDTSYVHNYEDSETFGVHGFITHNTLAKKYIDIIPVDPRTGSFYAYGKTKGLDGISEMYEIAGVILDGDKYNSFVMGDYTAERGPFNLIREYNGPDFVYNKSQENFPYNPLERILTAKIDDFSGNVLINDTVYSSGQLLNYELKSGDTIEVEANGVVELYYSDGSRSILGDASRSTKLTLQKMEFSQENNLITDIKLVLESGMIWNKAANLDDQSGFEIYTTDSTAAVRGTIFGVQKNQNNSQLVVKKGTVAVNKIDSSAVRNIATIKEYIQNNVPVPSHPITSLPGIIDFENQESVIKVENNNPEKGASLGESGISSNTGSINNIPVIIKDELIDNLPILNNNIQIRLNSYTYKPHEISIKLDIAEKVFKNADFVLINGTDMSKINDDSHFTQSGNTITYTLHNYSEIIENTYNSDSYAPNNNDGGTGTYPGTSPTRLFEYIKNKINNSEGQFSMQLGNVGLDGKIRLTNKIVFTILAETTYTNTQNDDTNLNGDDIIKEKETNASNDRGCDGFYFDNINGETNICANADDSLKGDGWELVAYAPYDHTGDIMMYNKGNPHIEPKTNSVVANITGGSGQYKQVLGDAATENLDDLPGFCTGTSHKQDSFCDTGDNKGIFLDKAGDDDYMTYNYSGLNSFNNYVLEFQVKGSSLKRNGTYVLYHDSENMIYTYGTQGLTKIKHNSIFGIVNDFPITTGGLIDDDFYQIFLLKEDNTFTLKIDSLGEVVNTNPLWINIKLSNDFYIGGKFDPTKYINQFGDMIDYVKIYKK